MEYLMLKKNNPDICASVTADELEELLKVYNIGKKPLAKLLGWGETALILFSKDGLLSDEYAVRLREIHDDPALYAGILMSDRERISAVAYRKSYEAVCRIFPLNAIGEAALFVTGHLESNNEPFTGDAVSLLRLETILFWSQAISLSLFARPLFDEECQPGRYGLWYPSIEERISKSGCIRPKELYPAENMYTPTSQEKEILVMVADSFSWYGSKGIELLAEAEQFRLCGPKGARRRKSVSADIIKKCYSEVFGQAKVKKLKDFENYLHKRMNFITRNKAGVTESELTGSGAVKKHGEKDGKRPLIV